MAKIKAIFRPILFGILFIISIFFISVIGEVFKFSELVSNLTLQLGLIIVVFLFVKVVKRKYGIKIKEHLDFRSLKLRNLFLLMMITIAIELVLIQLEAVVKIPVDTVDSASSSYNDILLIVSYIFGIFIAPFTEEILCRVIMIESCKKEIGSKFSVVLSSLIFSLLHLRGFFPTLHIFITALIMGYVYIKTNNAAYTIIMHCVTNLLLVTLDTLYKFGFPVYKIVDGETMINSYLLITIVIITIIIVICHKKH